MSRCCCHPEGTVRACCYRFPIGATKATDSCGNRGRERQRSMKDKGQGVPLGGKPGRATLSPSAAGGGVSWPPSPPHCLVPFVPRGQHCRTPIQQGAGQGLAVVPRRRILEVGFFRPRWIYFPTLHPRGGKRNLKTTSGTRKLY